MVMPILQLFSPILLDYYRCTIGIKPSSDIDLTLIGSNIDLTVRDRISAEIDDLLLPYRVDLSIYSLLSNQDLIDHIDRIGEIFYLKKEPSV
jgi:hypothetical protein